MNENNLTQGSNADWFDQLSTEQKEEILQGLSQADQSDTVSHEEAVKLFGKWGLK